MRELERVLMLRVVDTLWMDHLDEMEHVKREIGLRAYGQHDPVLEYRNVGSELYENMLDSIKKDTVRYVLSAMPRVKIEREQVAKDVYKRQSLTKSLIISPAIINPATDGTNAILPGTGLSPSGDGILIASSFE